VTSDEDGIGCFDGIATHRAEIADVDVDTWGAMAMGILMDDGFTLRTDLKGFHL
jgi:hypothetical protein